MRSRFKKSVTILFTICFVVIGITSLYATKMLHRNAEELASLANRVFIGVCVSAEEKQDGDLYYTEYTFEVLEGIKGINSGAILVFRQFVTPPGAGKIAGFPSYENGEKYMLFLREDSKLGLTSPIGLGQGAFRIFTTQDGKEKAINFFGNKGLFHRMGSKPSAKYSTLSAKEKSLMAITSGPVELNRFVNLIKKMSK